MAGPGVSELLCVSPWMATEELSPKTEKGQAFLGPENEVGKLCLVSQLYYEQCDGSHSVCVIDTPFFITTREDED